MSPIHLHKKILTTHPMLVFMLLKIRLMGSILLELIDLLGYMLWLVVCASLPSYFPFHLDAQLTSKWLKVP